MVPILITDSKVQKYLNIIFANQGQAYLVGGYVRDYLLNKTPQDLDIEVYHLSFTKLQNIFGVEAKVQSNFGVFSLKNTLAEFTIPRKENKIGIKHQDFMINLDPNMDLKTAAKRRDFTINALMYDIKQNVLLDFYHGQEDLKQKQLRHVSLKFAEDPLRILRAIRFSAQLGFTIVKETWDLCLKMLPELKYITSERKNQEIKKFLLTPFANFKIGFEYFSIVIEQYYDVSLSNFKSSIYLCNIQQDKYQSKYMLLFWSCLLLNLQDQNKIDIILQDMLIKKQEIKLIKQLIKSYQTSKLNNEQDILKILSTYKEDGFLLIELFVLQQDLKSKVLSKDNLIKVYQENLKKYQDIKINYQKFLQRKSQLNGQFYMQQGYYGKNIKIQQEKDLLNYINNILNNKR